MWERWSMTGLIWRFWSPFTKIPTLQPHPQLILAFEMKLDKRLPNISFYSFRRNSKRHCLSLTVLICTRHSRPNVYRV
jgi:hypothetical protein